VVLLFFVAYLCLPTDHTKIEVSIFIFTAATPKIDLVDNDEQKKIVHRQQFPLLLSILMVEQK
jgi:hypothetical protein